MNASILAVEENVAVVRVDVVYETPHVEEFKDVWILRFDSNGRVADYEEWAYWPGKTDATPDKREQQVSPGPVAEAPEIGQVTFEHADRPGDLGRLRSCPSGFNVHAAREPGCSLERSS